MAMGHFLFSVGLLGIFLHALSQRGMTASDFHLDGDYLIGGLFDIHYMNERVYVRRPEAIDCSSHLFSLSSYRMFHLMRFSVEQINNSTKLLPNVSLGYEVFDQCSDTKNFPGILNLISDNGLVRPWIEFHNFYNQKVIAVVGPFTSTDTLAIAPLFMPDLTPVVSYGAASSAFSLKRKFPSFLRTVHSNKNIIDVIVNIVQHFKWQWVAFLNSDNDFGNDGLELFMSRIKDTEICLAYTKGLNDRTNYFEIFNQIEALKIHVIIVFSTNTDGEALIESAIQQNIGNKVWLTGDTWSLNKKLLKMRGIKNIGTVLGVSQPVVSIPGFDDFIYSAKSMVPFKNTEQNISCNQDCNCSGLVPEDIVSMDPSFSFPVYSAVYAIAHALHNVLQCGPVKCNGDIKVNPYMVLKELRKSNFALLNVSVQFNENGDPKFGYFSIVYWNQSDDAQEIGFYRFYPSVSFFINTTQIQWYTDEVPTSQCSPECSTGFAKAKTGVHKCCFNCELCPNGTYVNITADPYNCISCKETEWSTAGSTSCKLRLVEYVPFTDPGAIVIMVGAWVLVGLSVAVAALFTINYNTPIVKSAGGPMCFLILGCLSLSTISVFFYFGEPTVYNCILRFLPFLLFYTVCLACFVVRSFQIVCIFKMAAKIPKFHNWWMKYHGQWLLISVAFITQAILLIISNSYAPPSPHRYTSVYADRIVLGCDINRGAMSCSVIIPLSLCSLCFIFSYMGKDLPKNYNEAKAITFCLLLLIFSWIIFVTAYMLYQGKHIQTFNALAVLSSLYSFLLWYFLPKCYIIICQPQKNTAQYFQGLIQNYTKTISQ